MQSGRFDSFHGISKVCLPGTQDKGNYLPSRDANSFLEHKQTDVISGGAEQTDRQGYAIKTSDYLFLWNPLPKAPVSDTAEKRNQCWSENLSGAQHGLATEILLWISI